MNIFIRNIILSRKPTWNVYLQNLIKPMLKSWSAQTKWYLFCLILVTSIAYGKTGKQYLSICLKGLAKKLLEVMAIQSTSLITDESLMSPVNEILSLKLSKTDKKKKIWIIAYLMGTFGSEEVLAWLNYFAIRPCNNAVILSTNSIQITISPSLLQ